MKGAASYIRHEEDKKKIEILNMIISDQFCVYTIENRTLRLPVPLLNETGSETRSPQKGQRLIIS
jgi:hypothetical protein